MAICDAKHACATLRFLGIGGWCVKYQVCIPLLVKHHEDAMFSGWEGRGKWGKRQPWHKPDDSEKYKLGLASDVYRDLLGGGGRWRMGLY